MSMYFAARVPAESKDLILQIINLLDDIDDKVTTPNVDKISAFAAKMKNAEREAGLARNETPVVQQNMTPQPNAVHVQLGPQQMQPYMVPGCFPFNVYYTPPQPNAPLNMAPAPDTTHSAVNSTAPLQVPPTPNGGQAPPSSPLRTPHPSASMETTVKNEDLDEQVVENTVPVSADNQVKVEDSATEVPQAGSVTDNNAVSDEAHAAPGGSTMQNAEQPLTRKRKLSTTIENNQENVPNAADAYKQDMKNANNATCAPSVYQCKVCPLRFRKLTEYRRHTLVEHNHHKHRRSTIEPQP